MENKIKPKPPYDGTTKMDCIKLDIQDYAAIMARSKDKTKIVLHTIRNAKNDSHLSQ